MSLMQVKRSQCIARTPCRGALRWCVGALMVTCVLGPSVGQHTGCPSNASRAASCLATCMTECVLLL